MLLILGKKELNFFMIATKHFYNYIDRINDNYLFLSSRPLKGQPKINKGGKEGENIKK